MSPPTASRLPWQSVETESRLELVHDHRWLKLFGLPLAGFGSVVSILLWCIPGVELAEAWPMLAVGSLIGIAFMLMGLHLSFNRVIFVADRKQNLVVQQEGFGWFTRQKRIPFTELQRVRIDRRSNSGGSFVQYTMELVTSKRGILVASFPELEPVREESLRWSKFLDIPLQEPRDGPR